MVDFEPLSKAIKQRFELMSKQELFITIPSGDDVWQAYLSAFPEGTNPIFRERTEYDCSCCKNFIRNIGNVVAIINGKVSSVWDVEGLDYPFDVVTTKLKELVESHTITKLFRTKETQYGNVYTHEQLEGGAVRRWNHFCAVIDKKHRSNQADTERGNYATSAQVFERGLKELTAEALDTVIELIGENGLYRGQEFLAALKEFRALQRKYESFKTLDARNIFVWANANNQASRFRNTAMGTLIQDLSEGKDLEAAVRSFESKVAPTNYKRPTALITKRMIEDAMKTINDLGLEPALERRFAKISDVNVNNVLWVDTAIRGKMKGGLEGLLMESVTEKVTNTDKAEPIDIDKFLTSVLPSASSLEVLVSNSMTNKFMSITAPVHEDAGKLFKWNNNFAWSYNGNITDSVKERVKKAGGSVTGDLCCRLAWDYKDDLDFHMIEPDGYEIYFSNRRRKSPNGGELDLDANGADGQRTDPAENIFYNDRRKMRKGTYQLFVNNWSKRDMEGVGFVVEVEFDGQVHTFNYDKIVPHKANITVAHIEYDGKNFKIVKSLPSTHASRDVWGVKTEQFTKVNTLMKSPNHWDGNEVGNKHWFFLLDSCKNPEAARGIYNEFLSSNLDKHRKVFELLGSKTKCEPTDEQLSGVGFSSTQNDELIVRCTGEKLSKLYKITF